MWRRIMRRHAWGVFRYADNLLRVPTRAVLWRIYKRQIMERWWERRAARGPAQPLTGERLARALGGDPEALAQAWLSQQERSSFFNRPSPRHTAELALRLCPAETERTIARANDFLAGRFRLLEAKPDVPLPDRLHPDWQANPLNDIEWPHALNRFRKYARCLSRAALYTGDDRYAEYLLDLMRDWVRSNPRGRPMAWSSMEISLRSMEWNWVLHTLRGSPALTAGRLAELWGSLAEQMAHLRRLPEIELSDNHLVYNLGALSIAAVAWPELRPAAGWMEWSFPRFLHELRRQHRADGFNVEQSTHYFQQVARVYAECWWWLRHAGRADAELERWTRRFCEITAGLLRPDGTIPLLSDAFTSFFEDSGSADARTLLAWGGVAFDRPDWVRAAGGPTEEAVWLLGQDAGMFRQAPFSGAPAAISPPDPAEGTPPRAPEMRVGSIQLHDSGYYVTRFADPSAGLPPNAASVRPRDSYLIFDVGPLGFPPVPAHGHPDLLSFEWWHAGRPIVVDPGTYEYEPGEWAYYFRRTRAHATVTVDGQDQATQWGFARWVDLPRWGCDAVSPDRSAQGFWIEGWHDGYARLRQPVHHRRRLAWLWPDLLVVEDILTGRGAHVLEQSFPLSPSVACAALADGLSARLSPQHGAPLEVRCVAAPAGTALALPHGQEQPLIWGWSAANYGVRDAATVVVFRAECAVPARFVTVFCAAPLRPVEPAGTWRTDDDTLSLTVDAADGFRAAELFKGREVRVVAAGRPAGQKGGWSTSG